MNWAVALTKPNVEFRAAAALALQGVDVYVPKIQERSVRRGKILFREVPLFKRYIFIIASAYHTARRAVDVVKVLMNGHEQVALISDVVIDELKSRVCCRICNSKFAVGERVRITAGPLENKIAIYQGMSSTQRERVLLATLGFKVDLQIGNLESAL